jgi:dTDP-4-amino-4,6-dideoxygalactose transaminase
MFRIWIYLSIKNFFLAIVSSEKISKKKKFIEEYIHKQSNKSKVYLFSQCRVAFLFVLKFLKKKNKANKNEIIICAYNLPEMINIALNLKLKIKFCDLDHKSGLMDPIKVKKLISQKTLAIIMTNMFNNYKVAKQIKALSIRNKIPLIEDNAIYFDNFSRNKNKVFFSGSLGDYSIYSFNIMKNISSLYGGAMSTNNRDFEKFYIEEEKKLKNFPVFSLLKQILIFFILKIMSINKLYKYFFRYIIKCAYQYKVKFLLELFYPSLKSVRKKFPKYYFSKISHTSINATYLQLLKKEKDMIFKIRKKNHKLYSKILGKIKNNNFELIVKTDENYQNFLDFPILVKRKENLNKFLINHGVEVRLKHYYNCAKMFNKKKGNVIAERYEKELICLPVHQKITPSYITFVAKKINQFYERSK